ncbi:MAG: ABC transporter ATP-binding protein [Oscillospiraceae bacterium]|jgi:ABC-2 type transport system ATP-binding protein|nr:ABC transporter ATP-binding protein [Oscillospiraceae bacterium]
MKQTMLKTHGLTKKYGQFTALNQASLTLEQGDIYGLVGRNGAGKTTFFKCVMGLAKPTAGEIEIGGSSANLNEARQQIGFMINAAFFPYLNPKQNLEYLAMIKGITDKGEIERLLKLVQLDGVKKPFKAFSMGMKQRLGLAAALMGRPPIVVLDEPINGLDPQGIADIRNILQLENEKNGTTFIVSSHILSELDLVATRFGFIEQGNLVKEISHTELHEHTKKALVIEVDDGQKALAVLQSKFGITDVSVDGNKLVLESNVEKSNVIARALFNEGLELFRLSPQETTLEEYFMGLVGGQNV